MDGPENDDREIRHVECIPRPTMTLPDPSRPADWDIVDEASFESFPASDPPAWGSLRAAPSASTVGLPEAQAPTSPRPPRRRPRTALGVLAVAGGLALGGLIVLGVKLRRARSWRTAVR